jgi:hypothetical protein
MLWIGFLSNDWFLFFISSGIAICIFEEVFKKTVVSTVIRRKRISVTAKYAPILVAPVFSGNVTRNTFYLDLLSLSRYIPCNYLVPDDRNELTENTVKAPIRPSFVAEVVATTVTLSSTSSEDVHEDDGPVIKGTKVEDVLQMDVCRKIQFPFMPGCEPDGSNAENLANKYPELSRPDIVRFLVARKGVLKAAEEMLGKCLSWRKLNFPLKGTQVRNAFRTKCFFPFRQAKDGSPIVYMRGGLYDCNVATPEEYVLAAAYTIDWSLRQFPKEVNVTVLVHTATVADGPNQSADTTFIKLFIQVLSDNYPERLKRLAIFPFPWYGRAIWGMLKVFVDKRTQDKVMLLSDGSNGIPNQLKEFVDPKDMPRFIGGTCDDPVPDLFDTIPES